MPTLFDDISDPANYPPGNVGMPEAALEGQNSSPGSHDEYMPNAPQSTNFEDRTAEPWWHAAPTIAASIASKMPWAAQDLAQYGLGYLGWNSQERYPQVPAGSLEAQAGANDVGQSLGDILNNAQTKQ